MKALAVSAASSSVVKSALGQDQAAASGAPAEWSYMSGKQYSDPFNQVDVDAVITLPSGPARARAWFLGGRLYLAGALRAARARDLPYSIRLQRHQKPRPS